MTPTRTIAGIGVGTAMLFGAVDASVLNETPLERVETIKSERVEVRQVGNVVEASMGWKGEPGLTVKADLGEPTIAERLADKRKKEVVTEVLNDSMKIDFLLNDKPDTNVFCQTIEGAEDYDFFYQPPLTQEEIAEGAERPENVVGSYAVYHKTLKNHKLGETNYETGKAWHIYRPQVWSLSTPLDKEWAILDYSNIQGTNDGQLCVTVPQDFLDKAEYPVRVDPTFGYTSVGGSVAIYGSQSLRGRIGTVSEDGLVDSVSVYHVDEDTANFKGIIVDLSKNIISDGVASTPGVITSTPGWRTSTFSPKPSVSGSTSYFASLVTDESTDFYYDAGGVSGDAFFDNSNSYSSPTNPTDATNSSLFYSIYATYTATPAEDPTSPQSEIWFD